VMLEEPCVLRCDYSVLKVRRNALERHERISFCVWKVPN
jgi:hypothetical protein